MRKSGEQAGLLYARPFLKNQVYSHHAASGSQTVSEKSAGPLQVKALDNHTCIRGGARLSWPYRRKEAIFFLNCKGVLLPTFYLHSLASHSPLSAIYPDYAQRHSNPAHQICPGFILSISKYTIKARKKKFEPY